MIRMSRSDRGPCTLPRAHLRPIGIVCLWHVVCSLGGCFYVKPIPPIDVNDPPVIVEPDEEPRVVVANGEVVVLTVIAYDPEGATVDFEWPDLDNASFDIDVYWRGELRVCRVEILNPEAVIGRRVRALVFDGDRDNVVTISFDVVAP